MEEEDEGGVYWRPNRRTPVPFLRNDRGRGCSCEGVRDDGMDEEEGVRDDAVS